MTGSAHRWMLMLGGAVLVSCGAMSANASLTDRGLYTHDTRTGKRWLDLTFTQGLSYNQVSANLGPGGLFANHVYATAIEVKDMLESAGMPWGTFQSPVTDPVKARMLKLQELFGVTATSNAGSFNRTTSNGLSSTTATGSAGSVLVPFIDVVDFTTGQDLGGVSSSSLSKNTASPGAGSWLLRINPGPGTTEGDANLPETTVGGTANYNGVDGLGSWFDPGFDAPGYTYATTDASKFTAVEMPLGVADDDQVFLVSDAINGDTTVAAGDLYTFAQAVSEFTISGIAFSQTVGPPAQPGDAGGSAAAFPAFLIFDQETVGFTATALPEPAAAITLLGTLAAIVRRRRLKH